MWKHSMIYSTWGWIQWPVTSLRVSAIIWGSSDQWPASSKCKIKVALTIWCLHLGNLMISVALTLIIVKCIHYSCMSVWDEDVYSFEELGTHTFATVITSENQTYRSKIWPKMCYFLSTDKPANRRPQYIFSAS